MDILFFNIFISLALKIEIIGEKATLYTVSEHLLWPTHRKIGYDSVFETWLVVVGSVSFLVITSTVYLGS